MQQPDVILVEAPAELDTLLADAANPEIKPPFAALLYQADSPQNCTRLAESLAGMRGRPKPGLDESLEAIQSVFCAGELAPLALLKKPLLIGRQMSTVPEGITNLPLQRDIEATQKRLRLKPAVQMRELVLDLREESARMRRSFLHRLLALSIHYGKKTFSRSQGTFKESWRLEWEPHSAAWLEEFLSAIGSILVHDTALLALVDDWLKTLTESVFVQVLPLLRRTFGQFSSPERSQIAQVVQSGNLKLSSGDGSVVAPLFDVDFERALPALTTVTRLFNLPSPNHD